jgi:hypothetical protein
VGVVESILKAVLLVLVASTGEKLAPRRTGRGATSTRLSSVALKLMSKRAKDERYLRVTGSLSVEQWERWVRGTRPHVTRYLKFDLGSLLIDIDCRLYTSCTVSDHSMADLASFTQP